jgi:hypothetical protein
MRERRKALGDPLHELFLRADKISKLSTVTLMYRSIPPSPGSTSKFCDECIAVATESLEEHRKCLDLLIDMDFSILELYIQWWVEITSSAKDASPILLPSSPFR